MIRRTLGKTTLNASRLGLGCVTFGREIDQADSFAVLDRAIECGINLFDTAEAYGGGQSRRARRNNTGDSGPREKSDELHSSELILGRWLALRRCRQHVIIQTKVLPPLSKQRVLDSIDASLARLQTDYIDLFMFHAFDPLTPLRDSLEAIQLAIKVGKVRFCGCSNFSTEQLRAFAAIAIKEKLPSLGVVQSNYNLAVRGIEETLLPYCTQHNVGIQTYSPLGAGFLMGKYNRQSGSVPAGSRFDLVPGHAGIYFDQEKFDLVDKLQALSARVGVSPAGIALSWVLKNSAIDCVLVGARTAGHVDQAVESSVVPFDPEWETALFGDARAETKSRKDIQRV